MESAQQITMVKENLAVAIALWAAAQRGVITGAFLPGKVEFTSYTGQMIAVSTPLEVRDNKDLLRCVNNQVRGAFAFSVMQTHRVLESACPDNPTDEPDPDLRSARCTLHLLNDAISRELLSPVWKCPPAYQHRFRVEAASFDFDASYLDGKNLFWEDFGGLNKYLDLLQYCYERVLALPPEPIRPLNREAALDVEQAVAVAAAKRASPTSTELPPENRSKTTSEISPQRPDRVNTSEDPTQDFLDECCVVSPTALVIAKDLYSAYSGWCSRMGHEPLVQRSFGMKLTDLGFQRRRRGRGRHWWVGIELAARAQTSDD